MNQLDSLERAFDKAGVPLQLAERPFVATGNSEIVQMDIHRTRFEAPFERVLLYPGRGTELQVTGTDPGWQQLVLKVREPSRRFLGQRWDVRRRKMVASEQWTTAALRRFLIGMDESHLFIAQLTTEATTVEQAHEGLRPAELERRPELHRQGEWFLVPATAAEKALLAKRSRLFFGRNERIGGRAPMRGRPHYAQQLVRLEEPGGRSFEMVRGRISHPDHATLHLRDWMRVFMNTENRNVGASWVD